MLAQKSSPTYYYNLFVVPTDKPLRSKVQKEGDSLKPFRNIIYSPLSCSFGAWFSFELIAQFHPVTCCVTLSPSYDQQKMKTWDFVLVIFKRQTTNSSTKIRANSGIKVVLPGFRRPSSSDTNAFQDTHFPFGSKQARFTQDILSFGWAYSYVTVFANICANSYLIFRLSFLQCSLNLQQSYFFIQKLLVHKI